MRKFDIELFKKITYCHFLTDWASNDFCYPPVFIWDDFKEQTALRNYLKELSRDLFSGKFYFDLYFHFPFCHYRCSFCRQFSFICQSSKTYNEYLKLLIQELKMWMKAARFKRRPQIQSLYLGGGTPTNFNLKKFFLEIKNFINFKNVKQIDIESTLEPLIDYQKLSFLKELKLNKKARLVIGIQSFDPGVLRAVNRYPHQKIIFKKVFENIKKWDLGEAGIDLLVGLPKQSMVSFLNDLKFLIGEKINVIHINYFLKTPLTILGRRSSKVSVSSKRGALEAIQFAEKLLLKNNYRKTPYGSWALRSRAQNLNLQMSFPPAPLRKNFLKKVFSIGLGPSAKGQLPDYYGRHTAQTLNTYHLGEYKRKIENGQFPIEKIYPLSKSENKRKVAIRSFRYSLINKELYKKIFSEKFESDFREEIKFLKRVLKDKLEIGGSVMKIKHFAGSLILSKAFYSPEVLEKCAEIIKKRYKNYNFDLSFIPYIEDFNKIIKKSD